MKYLFFCLLICNFIIHSSPIAVSFGGTGNINFTAYAVLAGGTTTVTPWQNVSGVGTSGQVLTSNGAAALPTWQADGNTGTTNGFVFISSQTASNSATLTFSLPNTYKMHLIILDNLAPSSSTVTLQALWGTDSSTFLNSGYSAGVNYLSYNSATVTNANSTTAIPLGTTTSLYYSGILYMYGANGALTSGPAMSGITASDYNPALYGNVIASISGNPTITHIRFQFSSGNISAGKISLYGLT